MFAINNISRQTNYSKIIKHLKPNKSSMSLNSRIFYMCSSCGGELETILFNGAGKAFLAPLVIAFNPLSKEKKTDKTYMAWKQPISAAVNLGTQLLIYFKVNKNLEKMAAKGSLGELYSLKALDKVILEQNKKRLNLLKGRSSLALGLITMPIACAIVNWLYPKAMNIISPSKNSENDKNQIIKGKKFNAHG